MPTNYHGHLAARVGRAITPDNGEPVQRECSLINRIEIFLRRKQFVDFIVAQTRTRVDRVDRVDPIERRSSPTKTDV